MMIFRGFLLGVLLIVAVAGDIRNYRISNATVTAGLMAGLITSLVTGGLHGLLSAMLAALVPAVLLIILYALRMLGAGDIKLFCAIGAIMGLKFVLCAMVYSFLAGGVTALFLMLARGNMKERLRHIAAYLKTCFLTGKLNHYTNFDDKSDGAKFHFSIAVAAGCVIRFVTAFIS